jgi:hypothetical protein
MSLQSLQRRSATRPKTKSSTRARSHPSQSSYRTALGGGGCDEVPRSCRNRYSERMELKLKLVLAKCCSSTSFEIRHLTTTWCLRADIYETPD